MRKRKKKIKGGQIIITAILLGVLVIILFDIIFEKEDVICDFEKYKKSIGMDDTDGWSCKMIVKGVIFDEGIYKCIRKSNSACKNPYPFNTIEECQETCFKKDIVHQYILFEQFPDTSQREILKENGVEFMEYWEGKFYIASIQIEKLEKIKQLPFVVSVYEIEPSKKTSFGFSEEGLPSYAISEDGGYNLIIRFYNDVPRDKAKNAIEKYGGVITNIFDYSALKTGTEYNFSWNYDRTPRVGVRFYDNNSLYKLASEDIVEYISIINGPVTYTLE